MVWVSDDAVRMVVAGGVLCVGGALVLGAFVAVRVCEVLSAVAAHRRAQADSVLKHAGLLSVE